MLLGFRASVLKVGRRIRGCLRSPDAYFAFIAI